jgi:peptide/nickel transport system permease protein
MLPRLRATPFGRPPSLVAGMLIGLIFLAAIVGAIWTPWDPILVDPAVRLLPPSWLHLLGTDEWGRDVFSRVLAGAGQSVSIGLATALAATVAGTLLGAAGGYLGGWLDRILLAIFDTLLAFPSLIMALGVVAVMEASRGAVIAALSIAYLPSVARVVRASVLSTRLRDFVVASTMMGNGSAYTLARHILPNTVGTVIVLATSLFGWALLAESALSFLGLGVPPPAPSWGSMLSDSRDYFEQAPWLALAPGCAISATLLGINLLGDALRDRLDPRMRGL